MDPIAMIFYAVICGMLGLAGPSLGRPVVRLSIGAVIGIVAATVLPLVRGVF